MLSPDPFPQKQVTPTRWEVEIPYYTAAYETPRAKGAPWPIVNHLSMVPRPVWIIEGESDDPFYNFAKVIMYMDKNMYRIYWKLVHNRAGEYFCNAMCADHWSKSADGTFSRRRSLPDCLEEDTASGSVARGHRVGRTTYL